MKRAIGWIIIGTAWLTAAEISEIASLVFASRLPMCGNVVSDPLGFHLNVVLPGLLGCAGAMLRLCSRDGRWPLLCVFALLVLGVQVVGILALVRMLGRDFGLPMGRIWWLPAGRRAWLMGR